MLSKRCGYQMISSINRIRTFHNFNIFSSRIIPFSQFREFASFQPIIKRKASESPDLEPSARKVPKANDYCNTQCARDSNGQQVWPAPENQMSAARDFFRTCVLEAKQTLIVPDKDADGISSGVIVYRTLVKMGLDPKLLDVHFVQKGSNIHEPIERKLMLEKKPGYIIVLDQGSRGGPRVVNDPDVRCIVIDHHLSDDFPEDALVVSACHCPPVATSALVTYEICKELHEDIASECGYLCAIGTHGDLGNTLKWLPPFPDMTVTFKTYTKKLINDCTSLINAPRRTGTYDVISAWNALLNSSHPKEIMSDRRLLEARQEINAEVEKRTHVPPKFSKDGKIAVLTIASKAQVHPVIATRWASHLKSKALEIVLVANTQYLPNKVNFSCRVARCARDRDPPVNIIESLKAVANLSTTDLVTRLGDNFARGHKEASGGIVGPKEFEELCSLMKLGEKPDKIEGGVGKEKKSEAKEVQKNTLKNYFSKTT